MKTKCLKFIIQGHKAMGGSVLWLKYVYAVGKEIRTYTSFQAQFSILSLPSLSLLLVCVYVCVCVEGER